MKTVVYVLDHDSDKNLLQEYLSNTLIKYFKLLTVYMQTSMYVFHYNYEKNIQSEYLSNIGTKYLKVLAIYVNFVNVFDHDF